MPIELELERQALRQLVLRQVGVEGRFARLTQTDVRAADLEGDILSLPDYPVQQFGLAPSLLAGRSAGTDPGLTCHLQILDASSAYFGKKRFLWGVSRFNDMDAVLA